MILKSLLVRLIQRYIELQDLIPSYRFSHCTNYYKCRVFKIVTQVWIAARKSNKTSYMAPF